MESSEGSAHNHLSFLIHFLIQVEIFSFEITRAFQALLDISTCSVIILLRATIVLVCVPTWTALLSLCMSYTKYPHALHCELWLWYTWRSPAMALMDILEFPSIMFCTHSTNCSVLILPEYCECFLFTSRLILADCSPLILNLHTWNCISSSFQENKLEIFKACSFNILSRKILVNLSYYFFQLFFLNKTYDKKRHDSCLTLLK